MCVWRPRSPDPMVVIECLAVLIRFLWSPCVCRCRPQCGDGELIKSLPLKHKYNFVYTIHVQPSTASDRNMLVYFRCCSRARAARSGNACVCVCRTYGLMARWHQDSRSRVHDRADAHVHRITGLISWKCMSTFRFSSGL